MARKVNPDVTSLQIEKLIEKKKKGKSKISAIDEVVPFDLEWERKPSTFIDGVNLVRPVTPRGVKFKNEKSFEVQNRKPTRHVGKAGISNSRVPNVMLRKPVTYKDEDSSKYSIRPNLSLRKGNDQQKRRFSDITLLKRPEKISTDNEGENDQSGDSKVDGISLNDEDENKQETPFSTSIGNSYQETKTEVSNPGISTDAMLLGKPKRLDQSVKVTSIIIKDQMLEDPETSGKVLALEDFISSPMKFGVVISFVVPFLLCMFI